LDFSCHREGIAPGTQEAPLKVNIPRGGTDVTDDVQRVTSRNWQITWGLENYIFRHRLKNSARLKEVSTSN